MMNGAAAAAAAAEFLGDGGGSRLLGGHLLSDGTLLLETHLLLLLSDYLRAGLLLELLGALHGHLLATALNLNMAQSPVILGLRRNPDLS